MPVAVARLALRVAREAKRDDVLGVPRYVGAFWTARQRAANALHEISYRACFKPALPRFFIEALTEPGDVVLDPFAGRGTTPLEAALLGRTPWSNDANPLSEMLLAPRLAPPEEAEVEARLTEIDWSKPSEEADPGLDAFYHPETLREILALRAYLLRRAADGALDGVDAWIRMVAINRLTGHSPGFFSVYTMPPNQAVTVEVQRKLNARRGVLPPRRDVPGLILRKTRALLRGLGEAERRRLAFAASRAHLATGDARALPFPAESVRLVVTSPPFLDVVDYARDNWLRCWFAGIDAEAVELTTPRSLEEWTEVMRDALAEVRRVLRGDGAVAFEVGEVRGGSVHLEEAVIRAGRAAGLSPVFVLVHDVAFTKTAHCWGVENRKKGTNTNRVVVFIF